LTGEHTVWCDTTYARKAPRFAGNDVWTAADKAIGGSCGGRIGKDGNVAVDPQFVGGGTGTAAFQLQPGSPLIDAGIPTKASGTTELAGMPRVVDGNGDGSAVVDMGALEFQRH
jgi:hypothetical protein